MKALITILLCLPLVSLGQKVALLDRNLKQPIIYTDSVTVQQIKSGLIPLQVENFDTLYANLNYLTKMLKIRQRAKMESFELRAGNSIITIHRMPHAYGDQYSIMMNSKIDEVSSVFELYDKKNNKQTAKKLEKMMEYLKSNKSLFKYPYEVTPKLYNVVVLGE